MVTPLKGEASSSSQFQSSISESGYSGMLPAELSCLDSQVSASGSSLSLGRWSGVDSVSSKAVVSTVGKGSGACSVWFVQVQH